LAYRKTINFYTVINKSRVSSKLSKYFLECDSSYDFFFSTNLAYCPKTLEFWMKNLKLQLKKLSILGKTREFKLRSLQFHCCVSKFYIKKPGSLNDLNLPFGWRFEFQMKNLKHDWKNWALWIKVYSFVAAPSQI
jgi:hypothetical protein